MNLRRIVVRMLVPFVVSLTTWSCASVQRQTPSMVERKVPITAGELRLRVYDFQSYFISEVESTAARIVRKETDLMIRENALRWETNAVSAIQGATFRIDPLAAIADAWSMTIQMLLYFQEGSGKELFGQRQDLVISVSKQLDNEAFQLVESIIGAERATEIRARLTNWARENAFTDLTFGRRSAAMDIASVTAAQLGTGGLGSAVQIEELLKDLSLRMSMYVEQIPKQVRRNTELLMTEMRRDFLNETLADIASIDDSADRIANFTDDADSFVAGQRDIVLAQLEQELTRVLESIDRQRVETIDVLQAEVDTAQVTLGKELDDAIQELKQERVTLMADLEAYTERTLEQATADSKSLIDHVFRRAMQLVLFVAGIVVVVMVLGRIIFRGRRTQT